MQGRSAELHAGETVTRTVIPSAPVLLLLLQPANQDGNGKGRKHILQAAMVWHMSYPPLRAGTTTLSASGDVRQLFGSFT
jgi:hypothetical protein